MKRPVRLLCTLLAALCLFPRISCAADEIDELLAAMTLHEKVCQLFFVQPEHFSRLDSVNEDSKALSRAFSRFPVGGVILFSGNMKARTLASLNAAMFSYAQENHGIGLFIGVDEEGGTVSHAAKKLKLKEKQPSAQELGSQGYPEAAYRSAVIIGRYLKSYGFNVDFAPVADIRTDVRRAEITTRSFGSDPDVVSAYVSRFVAGLSNQGVISVLKHFPGHGAVSGNTHQGPGTSDRTLEDWRETEFLPFRSGIQSGADMVMISHQLALKADEDHPSSLSPAVISLLRNELGFQGVVITDALRMEALTPYGGSGELCVLALEAGCDMLLLPTNFTNGYNGVMAAAQSGRLTEDRIDESVRRILTLKYHRNLIDLSRNGGKENDSGI